MNQETIDSTVTAYTREVIKAVSTLDLDTIVWMAERIYEEASLPYANVYICGNGGSAATASHMVCDLRKNTGKHLRVISLNDNVPLMTAIANDEDYGNVFAAWADKWFKPHDILIAISTSGYSENVVMIAEIAAAIGMRVFGLIGEQTNTDLDMYCDQAVHVQSDNIGVVEDVHLIINHIWTELIRKAGDA